MTRFDAYRGPPGPPSAIEPAERFAIIDTVTAIAAGADRHDWPRVGAAFVDQVTVDYTSLRRGETACVLVDGLFAQWRAVLPGFDRTLHLLSNHAIVTFDGTAADAEADFQAMHRIEDVHCVPCVRYRQRLIKFRKSWKVTSLTMT